MVSAVMSHPRVTVFGGTGFLGRRLVDHLLAHGFAVRIASRGQRQVQPPMASPSFPPIEAVRADIRNEAAIAAAICGSDVVANCVSHYVARGTDSFHSIHVTAASRVAALASRAGVRQLIHVSGIGANEHSRSAYIRSRGAGETAVRAAFPSCIVVRPAVMFGPDNSFLTELAALLHQFALFPLFGMGRTQLQPVLVDDVAEAIARCLTQDPDARVFELAGPRIYRYQELLKLIAGQIGARPVLMPVPFWLWRAAASAAELWPQPPITRNQVELMQVDTVAGLGLPGFEQLAMRPVALEDVLGSILGS
jgi:uncharacterized protein YbjT (DUF2867 family)